MKVWINNFVVETKKGFGKNIYSIHYSEEHINGIPKQLQILEGNNFYYYNLSSAAKQALEENRA